MRGLNRWSEPFGAHGGFHAHSAGQTLGRPDLDHQSLLLRESVQNSWDACTDKSRGIAFRMDLVELTARQRRVLLDVVLASPPAALHYERITGADRVEMLVVTDRRTRGLGGPTRSDVAEKGRNDFVGLVRNIGRSQDKTIGGGTYGFGKGILFETSSVGTIVIYTRTRYRNRLQSRFIAVGIGDDYQEGGKPYTGRHWWGRPDPEVGVEPYLDEEADMYAAALGMDLLGGETGTSIAVVAPSIGGEPLDRPDVERLAESALEWAWPHMVGENGRPTIRFGFSVRGEDLEVVDPRQHPLYKHYARAYELAVSTTDKNVAGPNKFENEYPDLRARLWGLRPKKAAGSLAVARFTPRGLRIDEPKLSKVALMRNPRFVVKYMPVERDPSDLEMAGVFIADPAVDEEFAKTEPVAHDDWQPVSLGNRQTSIVKVTLTNIKKMFSDRSAGSVSDRPEERHIKGVSILSEALGDVVSGIDGGGPRIQRPPKPKGPPGSTKKKTPLAHSASVEAVRLRRVNGSTLAEFTVRLNVAESPLPVRFVAKPKIVLDGGGLAEIGGLTGWRELDGHEEVTNDHLEWEVPGEHLVTVSFPQPDQARLTLDVVTEVVAK